MKLNVLVVRYQKIAEVVSEGIVINETQDALDLMADAVYHGARRLILYEKNLKPDFFSLRTKVAGEILQKFAQYHMKLAVIGQFEKYNSKSLNALIDESNRGELAFFVPDKETAIARLIGYQE
jgi:hypothetical protein